jgi:hypothetical protein
MIRAPALKVAKMPFKLMSITRFQRFRRARALRSRPAVHETRSGVDAGIREHDIEPAMRGHGRIEGPVQGCVVAHVEHFAANLEPR